MSDKVVRRENNDGIVTIPSCHPDAMVVPPEMNPNPDLAGISNFELWRELRLRGQVRVFDVNKQCDPMHGSFVAEPGYMDYCRRQFWGIAMRALEEEFERSGRKLSGTEWEEPSAKNGMMWRFKMHFAKGPNDGV